MSKKDLPISCVSLLTAFLCAGCANPGPPKPPSLHLPAIVKDLQAERSGDHVTLRWTTPSRTTDDMDIKGAMTAEICRELGTAPQTPAARASACAPVRRLATTPGPSEVADTLPAPLQSDPIELLTYRIQIFNSTGHSAGNSIGAYAAAGTAPPAITALRATASERGAILEWRSTGKGGAYSVDLKRVDISPVHSEKPAAKKSAPPPAHSPAKGKPAKSPKPREETPNEVHLRDPADRQPDPATQSGAHGDTTGTVDTTATLGDTYTYVAKRVRSATIGSRALEIHSEPSPPVTLAMTDTFPPKTPTGLATISGTIKPASGPTSEPAPYIDLSWEPNEEADLAGYRVYRQLARPDGSPQGPLARLTAVPIAAPAYRDIAVKPGQGYIYTVTAVDAAGNESAPSAKALEVVEPPH